MGKLILIIALALTLNGCFFTKEVIVIKEVKIPVMIEYPQPPVLPKPALPISDLKVGDNPKTVFEAYIISIKILEDFSMEVLEILNAYRKPDTPSE